MKEEGTPQIRDGTQMKTEEKDKLSYALIGYAMAAHREIGPGLDESFYHQFMYERARADGLELLTKPRGQLMHRQRAIDLFECDLLVPQRLICELKVLRGAFAAEHYAQIFCYLKFWGIRVGLLFDFGKESLVYKRIVRDEIPLPAFSIEAFVSGAPPDQTDQACASLIARAISRILTEFGLGYRDTTYEALFCAELAAESIAFDFPAVVRVIAEREQLGEARLKCIALREGIAVSVVAWRQEITAADRAIHQTYLKHLGGHWGVVINFGKREMLWQFVHPPSRKSAELICVPS